MSNLLRHVLLFAWCVSIFGCSFSSDNPKKEGIVQHRIPSCHGSECLPLSFEIVEEVNDGDRLYLLLSVTALKDWPVRDIAIRLAGYRDGMEVVSGQHRLSQLLNLNEESFLKQDQDQRFVLDLNVKEVSDYQVELLWGDEANDVEVGKESEKQSLVEITDLKQETMRQCSQSNCSISMKLIFSLINRGERSLKEVPLDVTVSRVSSTGTSVEEIVFKEEFLLQGIDLILGESKEFEILLEELPDLPPTERFHVQVFPVTP